MQPGLIRFTVFLGVLLTLFTFVQFGRCELQGECFAWTKTYSRLPLKANGEEKARNFGWETYEIARKPCINRNPPLNHTCEVLESHKLELNYDWKVEGGDFKIRLFSDMGEKIDAHYFSKVKDVFLLTYYKLKNEFEYDEFPYNDQSISMDIRRNQLKLII